jgi:REP-associated tyrosine transposase
MANTYTNLLIHIVFSTKHREPLIHNALKRELHKYLGGLVRDKNGILLEIGGMADHVHLVVKLRPDTCVSEMVKYIKANSSGWVNDRADQQGSFYWQTGYAAFTVSESQLPAVREYVLNQETTTADRHSKKSCSRFCEGTTSKTTSATYGIDNDDSQCRPAGAFRATSYPAPWICIPG